MTGPVTPPGVRIDLRLLAAWLLVGYTALHLIFSFFVWVIPDGTVFSLRSASAGFGDLVPGALPLVAVGLATWIAPQLGSARLIASVALVEYAVILFFGVVTLLIGLGARFDRVHGAGQGLGAVRYLVMGAAGLALLAVAGAVTLRAFTALGGRLPSVAPTR